MENIMKFFNNNYELDSSISMDEPDPLVQKIEKEIEQLFVDGGVKVVKINSEYESHIDSIDVELENKIVRFTADDNGSPCIDVLELPEPGSWGYGKIISTHYIKFEDDLIDFVDTL
tara:strand:+ start:214 stop:561 length:348 start_codon:yes stop_codon:yes gene_type:complete